MLMFLATVRCYAMLFINGYDRLTCPYATGSTLNLIFIDYMQHIKIPLIDTNTNDVRTREYIIRFIIEYKHETVTAEIPNY